MDRPDDTEKTSPPGGKKPADTDVAPAPDPGESGPAEDRTAAMKTRRQLALGGFPIEEKIGEGGMGVVYRAFDPDLHRTVAIKKIHPRLQGDGDYARRFTDEARAVAAVNHSNIAQIFSIHARDEDSPPFFVMEFVDGPSVENIVKTGGPVEVTRALEIAAGAARGLRSALSRGLIHSDIKPSNLLTTQRGDVKLVDFGLAQRTERRGELVDSEVVFGTPHYLSPEQARGWAVDHRSDIYSLGCTLFYLLTGRELFPDRNRVELVQAHCSEAPPKVSEFRTDVPADVDALLARMLAKKPEARFQTYDELVDAIERLLGGRRPGRQTGKRSRWTRVAGLVIPILVIVAGVSLWADGRRAQPALDPEGYFGKPYVVPDGNRGEGLQYDFTDRAPFETYRRGRYWTYPSARDDNHDLCQTPWISAAALTLQWANFPEPISLPPFTDFEEVEVAGLRFYGSPDFEITVGYDSDRPGNGLRIFFGVGERNSQVVECLHHGEAVDVRADPGVLGFTIEDNTNCTIRLTRDPEVSGDRIGYILVILQDTATDREQERLRLRFSIPAEAAPTGSVAFRAVGLTTGQPWTVSLREILVRGVIDREKIEQVRM